MIELTQVTKEYRQRQGKRAIIKNVDLTIEKGEHIGILGRNGAGKSTLIRLLGGSELPTKGTIKRSMSVSWPLAFSGGFQGSLTGLDNLKFVCRVYGADYDAALPFVEEFSALGSYLKEPVKAYSSGMIARLAFAISMAIEFDCFLIDEVIAVGDADFQNKCRIEIFDKRADRAMIMVSHDPNTIRQYCNSAYILHDGRLQKIPDIDQALEYYEWASSSANQIKNSYIEEIMIPYTFDSLADENAIRFAYLFLLGRNAENLTAVAEAASVPRDIAKLKRDVESSTEYKKSQTIKEIIRALARKQANGFEPSIEKSSRSSAITILQSCDPVRYLPILFATSKYNSNYAYTNGCDYQAFIGIKHGSHPHHAMYNRIFMLLDLIEKNYSGWAFYLDADAFIRDSSFSLDNRLKELRRTDKAFWLHNVHDENHPNYDWWNINDGCFAIDLGSGVARTAIKAWSQVYFNHYTKADFENARDWNDIINDQDSLWLVLKNLDLEAHVELEQFQFSVVHQALRSDGVSISPEHEISSRSEKIQKLGQEIYGF